MNLFYGIALGLWFVYIGASRLIPDHSAACSASWFLGWMCCLFFVEGQKLRRERMERNNPTPDDERGESQEAIRAQEKLRK